jgi:hypothetical protein
MLIRGVKPGDMMNEGLIDGRQGHAEKEHQTEGCAKRTKFTRRKGPAEDRLGNKSQKSCDETQSRKNQGLLKEKRGLLFWRVVH